MAEAGKEFGGRVSAESGLPGLSAWARVRDYRLGQLRKAPNAEMYCGSNLTADDILEFGFSQVVVATGCEWRRDGAARFHLSPIPAADGAEILTPDDIFAGRRPRGRALIYDDDHYYLGGALAEKLAADGCAVTLVTPASDVSAWTANTLELGRIQRRVLECCAEVATHSAVSEVRADSAVVEDVRAPGRSREIPCDCVLMVTARLPRDGLWRELKRREDEWRDAGIQGAALIGDALAPGTIAAAVRSGHKFARELGETPPPEDAPPFRREIAELSPDWPPARPPA